MVALEAALDKEGTFSQLGGEIQMWLALAYQVSVGSSEVTAPFKLSNACLLR